MKRFAHLILCYSLAVGFTAALATPPRRSGFIVQNLLVQVVLFTVIAAVPAYRAGMMSYVDVAWPCGLTAIGIEVALISPRHGTAAITIAAVYLAIGLRMCLPGIAYLTRHRRLPVELPRYRYQRIRWADAGFKNERLPMQLEIFVQCAANASVLAAPAVLLAFDPTQRLNAITIVGLTLWLACWSLEWLADHQKRGFAQTTRAAGERKRTCDTGLWRYSRHPNYFFQWMGWNALVLAAAPSVASVGSALALLAAPAFMYWTLVYFTGITPSEHFSVLKRPDYVEYQRSTNRLIPGPKRRQKSGGSPTTRSAAAAASSEL